MTERQLMCVGGPAHGQWMPEYGTWLRVPAPYEIKWTAEALSSVSMEMPEIITYERRKLLWPGWRFPMDVYMYPGVEIKNQRPDAWPNPLVRAVCRCNTRWDPYRVGRLASGVASSACHLDHCPVHDAAWRPDPVEDIQRFVATEARLHWLRQHGRWAPEPRTSYHDPRPGRGRAVDYDVWAMRRDHLHWAHRSAGEGNLADIDEPRAIT